MLHRKDSCCVWFELILGCGMCAAVPCMSSMSVDAVSARGPPMCPRGAAHLWLMITGGGEVDHRRKGSCVLFGFVFGCGMLAAGLRMCSMFLVAVPVRGSPTYLRNN